MQEKDLRILFEAGDLKKAQITPAPLALGQRCVQLHRKTEEPVMLDAQRVSPRTFKTLDAAYKAVAAIGFRKASVEGLS